MRKSQKSPKSKLPRRSRVNSAVNSETTSEVNAAAGEFGWPRISLSAALIESALIESTLIASSLSSEASNSIFAEPQAAVIAQLACRMAGHSLKLMGPFETELDSAKAGWLSRSAERHA